VGEPLKRNVRPLSVQEELLMKHQQLFCSFVALLFVIGLCEAAKAQAALRMIPEKSQPYAPSILLQVISRSTTENRNRSSGQPSV